MSFAVFSLFPGGVSFPPSPAVEIVGVDAAVLFSTFLPIAVDVAPHLFRSSSTLIPAYVLKILIS